MAPECDREAHGAPGLAVRERGRPQGPRGQRLIGGVALTECGDRDAEYRQNDERDQERDPDAPFALFREISGTFYSDIMHTIGKLFG